MEDWETDLVSIFGEYQWNINDQFTTFASARLDNHTYAGTMFSPKGVLIYTPSNQDAFKLMASKSVRTNSAGVMKQLDSLGRNIDTEDLKAYELRYERQQTKNLSAAASVFYYDHDQIAYAEGTYNGFQPIGTVESWGVELEASYRTKKARFDISHSYTKMLGMDVADGIRLDRLEISAAPMGFGSDFANWSNHQTKMSSHYEFNEQWSVDGSVCVLGISRGKRLGCTPKDRW